MSCTPGFMPMRLFDPTTTTVLFGAGVSRDAGGPDARQLIDAVAHALLDDDEASTWIVGEMQARRLRFETAMDELANVADPGLNLFGLFDSLRPGVVHQALAAAGAQGAWLLTVNFDHLQERALREAGRTPWTVDLQNENVPASGEGVAVVKLHGTMRLSRGTPVDEPALVPLHATISAIVAAGGGAGLAPAVEDRLRRLVDGRALVVVGYSGSDDLDVVPTLTRCRPSSVVWIDHTDEEPAPGDPRTASPDAVAAVLATWQRTGSRVSFVRGRAREALTHLGLHVPEEDAALAPDHAPTWLRWLGRWAAEARSREPTGYSWAAGIAGSLGRFDLEGDYLRRSRATATGVGWTPQRRLLQIAENEYLCDTSAPAEVIEKARLSAEIATAVGDLRTQARARLLVARALAHPDVDRLDEAMDELDAATALLGDADADGVRGDLALWRARVHKLAGRYRAAADEAGEAHRSYARSGDWALMSEALMVRGQSLALDDDADAGLRLLDEAMRIAQEAPYPERQIAAAAVIASVGDARGDVDRVLNACAVGIQAAEATGHLGEVAELHFLHGAALAEVGDFRSAAGAYNAGLESLTAWTAGLREQLACGLAEMLVLTGCADRALDVLDAHEAAIRGDARHVLHATAVRWRAGRATEADLRAAAAAVAAADLPLLATIVFALARLAVPGTAAQALVEQGGRLAVDNDQPERAARLARAGREAPW